MAAGPPGAGGGQLHHRAYRRQQRRFKPPSTCWPITIILRVPLLRIRKRVDRSTEETVKEANVLEDRDARKEDFTKSPTTKTVQRKKRNK